MNDTDSIFSNNSDTEDFPENYLDNIPEDSDSSDEDYENDNDSNSPPLVLEAGLKFFYLEISV